MDNKMNQERMFELVKKLCEANGLVIVKIAKECNTHPDLVAKFFMELMQSILDKIEVSK